MDITPQYDFEIALVIGILFTFAFTGGIVALMFYVNRNNLNQQIKALEEKRAMQAMFTTKLIEAEERTKRILAAELHDDIGSALTAIKIMLFNSIHSKTMTSEAKSQTLTSISEEITEVVSKVRNISSLLLPIEFQNHSLKEALEIYLPKLNAITDSSISWNITEYNDNLSIADKLALFRVIQEAINNAIKYANSTSIKVLLKIVEQNFELNIVDDGNGFDIENQTLGLGLNNMRARSETIGAEFNIITNTNKGVKIQLKRQ